MSILAPLAELLRAIDQKKKRLDAVRPLPKELLKNIRDWDRVELTYTSNALEGNSLTAGETAIILEKGIAIGGKPLKDHLEAINHGFAFDNIMSLVQRSSDEFSLSELYAIHQLILRSIDDANAGKLRTVNIRITGLDLKLADHVRLPELMEHFIDWLTTTDEHPVLRAADAHLKLVTIHPFIDGNGRTARLLMNLLLMQAGYPPAVIKPEERAAYIDALQQAQLYGNNEPFREIIAHAVERSLDRYLEQVEG